MTSSIFSPLYMQWPGLQAAINHAERAHALLERMTEECLAARRDQASVASLSPTEKWLLGRPLELLTFAEFSVASWKEGTRSAEEVAFAIEYYLQERVHEPLANDFGLVHFDCCPAEEHLATTVTYVGAKPTEMAETLVMALVDPSAQDDSDVSPMATTQEVLREEPAATEEGTQAAAVSDRPASLRILAPISGST
jgi:hypothetical protein